jgi:S1-C subfamily serine protease
LRNIASLAIASLILAGCASTDIETESRNFQVQQTSLASGTAQPASSMQTLVQNSGPSYVTLVVSGGNEPGVLVQPKDQPKSAVTAGSGFVVDNQGHIMTAAHVAVRAGNSISARAADGRVYSGRVIAIVPGNDMALIKLRGFSGKPVSPAGNRCLAKGSMVYSLGRPHAQGDTARVGELESPRFGRAVAYGKFGYPDAMVLRLSTQKGESGGPLFNQSGQLVGMIVSTLYDGAGQPLNLAHAIPLENLAGFLCGKTSCPASWQAATARESCSSG